MQFAVENEADVMNYFDHYNSPELTEIIADQTNLYAQQQIAKMPHPVTKHACKEDWKPVTVIKMKKNPWFYLCNWYNEKPKLKLHWSRGIFLDSNILTNNV